MNIILSIQKQTVSTSYKFVCTQQKPGTKIIVNISKRPHIMHTAKLRTPAPFPVKNKHLLIISSPFFLFPSHYSPFPLFSSLSFPLSSFSAFSLLCRFPFLLSPSFFSSSLFSPHSFLLLSLFLFLSFPPPISFPLRFLLFSVFLSPFPLFLLGGGGVPPVPPESTTGIVVQM